MLLPISSPQLPIPPQLIIKKTDLPKPKQFYTIQNGDNLTTIAETHSVDLSRLWAANPQLTNPDVLAVADPLQIPEKDEVLADRPMPVTISNASERVPEQKISPQTLNPGGFSNLYSYGYCTFGVKNWRPDIPNSWGDAVSWLSNAQAMGWATGDSPKVGAIAWARTYGHVAYVLSISGNMVHIREENYQGWNIVSERDAPISEFAYIY